MTGVVSICHFYDGTGYNYQNPSFCFFVVFFFCFLVLNNAFVM